MIKVTILMLLFIWSAIFNCKMGQTNPVTNGVNLTTENQIFFQDTTIAINSSLQIYYSKDLVLFEYPYTFDSTINGKLVYTENRKAYFVFQKDSSYGYHYDPAPYYSLPNNKRLLVDSVHYKHHNSNYDTIFNWKPDNVVFDSTQNILKETYYYPRKTSDSIYFTFTLYYTTELLDIPESFSKKLDSSRNSKLFKVVFANNEDTALLKRFHQPRLVTIEQMVRNNKMDSSAAIYLRKYQDTINTNKVQR